MIRDAVARQLSSKSHVRAERRGEADAIIAGARRSRAPAGVPLGALSLSTSITWNSPKALTARGRDALVFPLGVARLFPAFVRFAKAAVLYPAAPTERHRHAAHGARVPADTHGRPDPVSPHARFNCQLGGWHRPTPVSPRRSWSSASSRPKARPGTISGARASSSACGSGSSDPVRRSRARCGGSAPLPIGPLRYRGTESRLLHHGLPHVARSDRSVRAAS